MFARHDLIMLRVVIVGRPNVGKSALLNRLAQRNVSIVHDQPGVTRDRISAMVEREGKSFEFVDTGGIGLFETETTPREIAASVQMQVDIAIESADLILIVMDGLEGVRPLDQDIVAKLRKSAKKLWLIVNKLDFPMHEPRAAEFSRFGIDPVFSVSASHGRGMERLWKSLLSECRKVTRESEEKNIPDIRSGFSRSDPRIAVVGRPNVGKSSLVNRLLGAERVIVSAMPGTTRDSVEMSVEYGSHRYSLIDTAGIRHKSAINSNVEMYSRHWTEKSISRADIVLLILSSPEGATRQDREIAGMVLEYHKPCLLLVNKWDLNEELQTRSVEVKGEHVVRRQKRRIASRSEYEQELRRRMPFLDFAHVMFISALEGYHALGVWKEIDRVNKGRKGRFTTGVLNRIFSRAQERLQPPMVQGRRLKIYYVTQKLDAPVPTFVLFVNQQRLWVESYGRYLINQIRKESALTGCPIILQLRERETRPMVKGRVPLTE
jgi:GTP-binding protein